MTAAICSTVLTLPDRPAAMTRPCSTATRRRPLTTNSRATNTTHIHADMRSRSTMTMNAVTVSSLSAMGSMNLPKLVTRPRLRAMRPSNRSVSDAQAKTASAATFAANAPCPSHMSSR